VYNFAALTDHDFELLVADLLGTDEEVRYEVFARGPDLGVDLRREDDDGGVHVVQCKLHVHSTVADLRKAARGERKKLGRLRPRPASYRFVTSRRLTVANKRDLKSDLAPFIRRQADIFGEHDLELVLNRHPAVQRRHIKLWLSSAAQLGALLNSGTYSRSRALAEEIAELLPRWVPGEVFFDARELLHKEHVCVIAGVPGIGKTTLAKMLLADAIDSGYEPVSVSADIEEAWSVYDPGQRQIFYYDDFLGRTALTERLGKNEEDRLLGFMKRAAASRTTLFVLTTREYILQQATELYEQLAHEGVEGRRFLLELAQYSRTDRARIFYNHASFSDGLSRRARRALLAGRAYEKIIDHPAYNPRHTEWITGLSGHRLTAQDNADYVAFAIDALSHPERIWQHGFEHQLNFAQRALLLVLATMPDRVEHDDLERAFEAFADVAGITTRERAFRRALKILDDSFIRTYHDEDQVFIAAYDPSVADFLAAYIRSSPPDARLLVRGAVFFEQLQSLARVLPARTLGEAAAAEYVGAVQRCLDAPSCSWYEVYFGSDATEPTITRRHTRFEERVEFVGQVRNWRGAYGTDAVRTQMRAAYRESKDRVRQTWSNGRGDPEEALALLRAMRQRKEGIQAHAIAAKALVTEHLHYPYAFSHLIALRDLAPTIFGEQEWAELRRRYLQVASDELGNWRDMRSVDDIYELERWAERMGVELNAAEIGETRQKVEEAIAEAEDRASQPNYDRFPDTPDPDGGKAEIEALFTRLANQ
jgi:hypothetical protein